jgi:hypothetical protein
MTIPVVSRDQMVAVVGVANKAEPYTPADVSQLTQIMDVVWKIAERQQAEERLRLFAEQLEARVKQRTDEFERAHAELEAANTEIAAANSELQNLLTEQERLQSELAYRALHDPLTGLANRTMFQERLWTTPFLSASAAPPFYGSIWIISKRSTTFSATRWATRCSSPWRIGCERLFATPTTLPVWAATSLPWSCRT